MPTDLFFPGDKSIAVDESLDAVTQMVSTSAWPTFIHEGSPALVNAASLLYAIEQTTQEFEMKVQ